ncbi:MAG: hypothetical protein K940chlam2_00955 [Chlamydiae bacterium]|nr:hypothetical protein [Chlamydiota bacterium]
MSQESKKEEITSGNNQTDVQDDVPIGAEIRKCVEGGSV